MPTPPDDPFPARDDAVRDDSVPFPAPPAAPGARDREAAFTAAFTAHYPAVLAFARRRIGDVAAEDVAAEAFTVAWRRWDDAPDDVRPWLFGIAKNVMSGRARSERRRDRLGAKVALQPPREAPDPGPGVAAHLDLQAAWSQLSEPDREAIALVAWDGLTSEQAAEVLAITRMAYAARLSRARRRLRHRLSEREHRVRGGTAADTGPDPDPDADRAPTRLWAAPSPARSARGDAR